MLFRIWIAKLLIGNGGIPCDLPKIEMDAEDELFMEVRNGKGEITLRIKVDVAGALEAERRRLVEVYEQKESK